MADQQPACKSDVEYNFGLASGRDLLVHGAARPGAKSQRCFNVNDKVTEIEVLEWADFMKAKGVKRVVGLLTKSEREQTFEHPPSDTLNKAGLNTVNIDVEEDPVGGTKQVLQLLQEAAQAKEKVVVHCWGGGGRTGRLLAAYLMSEYGLSPEDAAAEVAAFAKTNGASRRVDIAAVRAAAGN